MEECENTRRRTRSVRTLGGGGGKWRSVRTLGRGGGERKWRSVRTL